MEIDFVVILNNYNFTFTIIEGQEYKAEFVLSYSLGVIRILSRIWRRAKVEAPRLGELVCNHSGNTVA